jgi:16S rRNA (cytosine1402-N4)-methyltransferase
MHTPVLLTEAITGLNLKPNTWYLDGTFGRGGHTSQMLQLGAKVVAFDVDQEAIEYGQQTFATYLNQEQLILVNENFDRAGDRILKLQTAGRITELQGALFDFGTSSDQLLSPARGFGFESEAELDMRMDQRLGVKAIDLLRLIDEKQLAKAFSELGGEREAKAVASALRKYVLQQTDPAQLTATKIAAVIAKSKYEPRGHLHPATKVFQALRMLVNSELEAIQLALPQVRKLLKPGGRIVTIAFHEGEDRIIKHLFADWERQALGKRINKDVIVPSDEEQQTNPRSRSAKMRIFEV